MTAGIDVAGGGDHDDDPDGHGRLIECIDSTLINSHHNDSDSQSPLIECNDNHIDSTLTDSHHNDQETENVDPVFGDDQETENVAPVFGDELEGFAIHLQTAEVLLPRVELAIANGTEILTLAEYYAVLLNPEVFNVLADQSQCLGSILCVTPRANPSCLVKDGIKFTKQANFERTLGEVLIKIQIKYTETENGFFTERMIYRVGTVGNILVHYRKLPEGTRSSIPSRPARARGRVGRVGRALTLAAQATQLTNMVAALADQGAAIKDQMAALTNQSAAIKDQVAVLTAQIEVNDARWEWIKASLTQQLQQNPSS